ncbi:hypothetical protein PInf_014838 [Phytophthora infestans]|nr:hypothetical protein PInf_014838 [Phytophthora infestans]
MLKAKKPMDTSEAFKALEVEKATGNLFESQQWKDWANSQTKEIAKLEEAQLKRWISLKSSPNSIFETLKLNDKADDFLGSPQFATWTSFLKAYNQKNEKNIKELDILIHFFKEDGLTKMISSADNINNPRTLQYLDELMPRWLDRPTHPQHIFTIMRLDEAGADLLTNPLLSRWVKYMEGFNKEFPFAQTSIIKTLTKNYGDEKLAAMLQSATKASDENTAKIANNLQQSQFKHWMADKLTPDDLFKTVLKLESTSSPNANIWRAYYNAYDEAFPGKLFSFDP